MTPSGFLFGVTNLAATFPNIFSNASTQDLILLNNLKS